MGFMAGLTSALSKGSVLDLLGLPAFDRRMTARAEVGTRFDEQTVVRAAVRAVAVTATALGYRPVNGIEILLPSNARVTGFTEWTRLIEEQLLEARGVGVMTCRAIAPGCR